MSWKRTAGLGLVTAALATLGTTALLARDHGRPPAVDIAADSYLTLRFTNRVRLRDVGAFTVRIRDVEGVPAAGTLVRGAPLLDQKFERRVVVRPEAVREFYELVRGLDRSQAIRRAERLLRRVERTGRLGLLERVDRRLGTFLDVTAASVLRVDDPNAELWFPPTAPLEGLASADLEHRLLTYRRAIAGHDDLWRDSLEGDYTAFRELAENPDYERFFHPVDPERGVPLAHSVLRGRQHRRMLIDRNPRRLSFFPRLPVRADLSDGGFTPGAEYQLDVRRPLRGVRRLFTALGDAARLGQGGRASLSVSSDTPLAGVPTGVAPTPPRVVNVTPPDGEQLVDATTDWEDPDDTNTVIFFARRSFAVRVRFAVPLDPRTVTSSTFQLVCVARDVDTPDEAELFEPVACGIRLIQSRLGQVTVKLLPTFGSLDARSRYQVRVGETIRALDGSLLRQPFRSEFTTH